MQGFIDASKGEIATLCREYDVRRLAIFGSAVRDDFNPEASDVDLLVEFETDSRTDRVDRYFGLHAALERLFRRRVDLVMAGAVKNPYISSAIERDKVTLYAA